MVEKAQVQLNDCIGVPTKLWPVLLDHYSSGRLKYLVPLSVKNRSVVVSREVNFSISPRFCDRRLGCIELGKGDIA